MLLRDIPFEPVSNASGGRNFFGEGYWFHGTWNALSAAFRLVGVKAALQYEGANFVAKTTTLNKKPGNMPLVGDTTTPKELIPKCIKVLPKHRAVLNKVGLSGPGLERLLNIGQWQTRTRPFFLSYMATGQTLEEKLADTRVFATLLATKLSGFNTLIGLQVNFSCPNVDHGQKPDGHQESLIYEVGSTLDILAAALPQVPLVPKFSVELHPAIAVKIAQHPALDALVVSNTVPWLKFKDRIDWQGIFGTDQSPLKDLEGPGGGGLSGTPIFPLMLEWVGQARQAGLKKPIIACGGILSPDDVRMVADAGASGIEVGSASILCPWNVQSIIDEGRRRFR
ncbi:hypothetical protein IT087_02750 [Candidatus Uhrbacteria bacterium]|nr:hypothetical protein [Candidatus Uhrbacteria bacterium]